MPDGSNTATPPRISARLQGSTAELILFGPVGSEVTASGVQEALKPLATARTLVVRINSPGGSLIDANAIFNALRRHPARKQVVVEGIAASAASLIAMVGDEIVMPANAFLMLHHPSADVRGTATEMREQADVLARLGETCVAIYSQRSKQPADKVRELMDAETWLSAEEAVALGFADRVEAPFEAVANFDLSSFTNPPAALTSAHPASLHKEPTMTTPTPGATASAASFAQIQAIATRANLGSDFIVAQLSAGATEATAQEAAIDAIAAQAPKRTATLVQVVASHDDPGTRREHMAEALAARCTGKDPSSAARAYMGMPVTEMARELLEARGQNVRRLSKQAVVDATMSFGAHTTSDFPILLTGTGNRILADSYTAATSPLRSMLCKVRDVPDFRSVTHVQLGEFPVLDKVNEHGAVPFGTTGEVSEGYKVDTHAKQIGLTREALINDDLNAFSNMASWAGSAVAETEARVLLALLAANSGAGPTMSDGKTLFHAEHGNLAASGGAINAANVSTARAAMRKQKGIDGVTAISVAPKYLLVSPDKETEADTLLTSLTTPELQVNPLAGKMMPLVEPRLTGNAWFLFADPAQGPVFEVAYLTGSNRAPEMKTFEAADFLGFRFRVVHDFGAGVIGWRGAYRNPGA